MDESAETIFWLRRALDEIVKRLEAVQQIANDYRSSVSNSEKREREAAQRNTEAITEEARLACAIERKHSAEHKQNLCVQWVIGIGTWAAVLAASIYAGMAIGQLLEMRAQTRQIATQFEAQQHPWVGNGEIKVKQTAFLLYPDNPIQARTQLNLDVDVPLKNVGNSPALNLETWVIATATGEIAAPPTIDTMMESACGGFNRNAKSVGQVLFPNSPGTTVEWPMATMTPFTKINEIHRVWIDICVRYSAAAQQKIHHTKIWMASWPINGNPKEISRTTKPRVIYYSLPITGWVVVKTEAD